MTDYYIRKHLDGVVEITALVSPSGFYPEGNSVEWIEYAKEKARENDWDKIEVYREKQDKQTGYTSSNLIWKSKKQ